MRKFFPISSTTSLSPEDKKMSRIRINGILYEEVLNEKARNFDREDYRVFNLIDLPSGKKPKVYWKDVDWVEENEPMVVAIGGSDDPDDSPYLTFITFQWLDFKGRDRSASSSYEDEKKALKIFNKIARDIDELSPEDIVKKYKLR